MDENFRNIGFLLNDVARIYRKRFEQHARGSGLTRAQWQVLAHLARNEGLNQSALADLLDVEPITLGRIVEKLERYGLIERRAHPTDRRVRLLHLTPAAHPKLEDLRELGDRTRSEALTGVSEEDRTRLVAILQHLKSNLIDAADAPVPQQRAPRHG